MNPPRRSALRGLAELGGEVAGITAKKFFGGDLSVLADFLEHCVPLYRTESQGPDAFLRTVMNFDLMSHFFSGEALSMDLRAELAAACCPVLVIAGELDPVMPMATTHGPFLMRTAKKGNISVCRGRERSRTYSRESPHNLVPRRQPI